MVVLTAACLPLYAVRWHYGPIPTTLLETLVLLTVLAYVAGMVQEGSLRFNRTPLDIPILLLLVSGVISIAVASDHRAAIGLYRAYFIEPVAIFYVAFDLLRVERHFRNLLIGFAAGSSAFALLNIVNFAVVLARHRIELGAPPSAIYTSSNEVAMFLEPPLAFAAALVLLGSTRFDRRLGAAWGGVVLVALILTISRAMFLALAVYVVFAAIALVGRYRKQLLVAVAAAAAIFIAVIVIGANTPLVVYRLSPLALLNTSEGRYVLWEVTLQMMAKHPIFGLGLGGFRYVFHGFPEIYPHDLWLTFWVELGLLGLLAFAYIFFWLLVSGWRGLHRTEGFDRLLVWGALGAFVLWGVHGLFDSPYWKNDMSVEFWIVAAVQLAALPRWRALTEVGRHGYRAPANGTARPQAGSPDD